MRTRVSSFQFLLVFLLMILLPGVDFPLKVLTQNADVFAHKICAVFGKSISSEKYLHILKQEKRIFLLQKLQKLQIF